MLLIRSPEQVFLVRDDELRNAITDEVARLLLDHPGTYDPEAHGWFLVMEAAEEVDDRTPFHGRFSLREIFEGQLHESVQEVGQFMEVIVALDDSEAVAVYLPLSLLAYAQGPRP